MPDAHASIDVNTLTIVICNYNYGTFLRGAIDSALAQVTADGICAQVMVIDDGSTDDSPAIIRGYGERVLALFQPNAGQVAAYNRALCCVATSHVLFLDADDVLYPGAVSAVMAAFSAGNFVKVQFRLEVMTHDGAGTGVTVPQTVCVADCGDLLREGWLYPSPPGSGNAYRVDALRRIFPVPVTADNRYGADFYAIYGIALLGAVGAIDRPFGGYRVHRASASVDASQGALAFANSEDPMAGAHKAAVRWAMLRELAQDRLGETLPEAFRDFSTEKARFGSALYRAPLARRWRWFLRESGGYFRAVLGNPFWSIRKKLAVSCLTALCLVPSLTLSDRAVRFIANPLARSNRVPATGDGQQG